MLPQLSWCLAACLKRTTPRCCRSSSMPVPIRTLTTAAGCQSRLGQAAHALRDPPACPGLLHRTIKRPSNLIEVFSNCLQRRRCMWSQPGNLRSLEVLPKAGAKLEGAYTQRHFNRRRPCTARPRAATRPSQSGYLKSPGWILVKDRGGKRPAYWAARRGYTSLAERLKALEETAKASAKQKKSAKVAPGPENPAQADW